MEQSAEAEDMKKVDLTQLLDGKWEDGTRPKDLFSLYVSKDPSSYVDVMVKGLQSDRRRVQSGCAELASILSESHPKLLYPHIRLFQINLDAKEPVLRWEAVCTLGNLVFVDKKEQIRGNVERIMSFLDDKSIVLQVHSVRALTKVAQAFPDTAQRIFRRLLDSTDSFPGNRIGFIVEAMEVFAKHEALVPEIRSFVEAHARSEIRSVATKARKVLKKIPES